MQTYVYSMYTVQNLHLKAMQNNVIKKFTCKGTLRQVFICLRPRNPLPPLSGTLYTCKQYTYSHWEGGDSCTREKVREATVYQNTNMDDCI
jgi:hypothetical protein